MVNVVGRLIDAVKAEGPNNAIDISDIAQRESFDVIGMVSHTAGPWMLSQSCVGVYCTSLEGGLPQPLNVPSKSLLLQCPNSGCPSMRTGGFWEGLSGKQEHPQ